MMTDSVINLNTRQGFSDHLRQTQASDWYIGQFEFLVKTDEDYGEFWQLFRGNFDRLGVAIHKLWMKRKKETPIKSFPHFIYAYNLHKKDALESVFAETIHKWDIDYLESKLEQRRITLEQLYSTYIDSARSVRFLTIVSGC
jgi:catalase (peroxidase I)